MDNLLNDYQDYRKSVRGILPVKGEEGDSVVLVHRNKNGKEYYVVPGGGIEPGENHEKALKREMYEEINAKVKVKKLLVEHISDLYKTIQYFYLCSHTGGKIKAGSGPEFTERINTNNFYEIEKVSSDKLVSINIVPDDIRVVILDILSGNVPNEKVIIKE